jgi:hypothetical protein
MEELLGLVGESAGHKREQQGGRTSVRFAVDPDHARHT